MLTFFKMGEGGKSLKLIEQIFLLKTLKRGYFFLSANINGNQMQFQLILKLKKKLVKWEANADVTNL